MRDDVRHADRHQRMRKPARQLIRGDGVARINGLHAQDAKPVHARDDQHGGQQTDGVREFKRR